MAKHSKQRPKSQQNLYLAAAIGVVVLLAAVLFTSHSTPVSAQDISPTEYQNQFTATDTTHLLLDVRTPEEFASGHIAGAVNIPVDDLNERLSEVPADQPIVIYCRSGNRSAQAAQILAQAGYTEIYDMGGLNTWTAQGLPLEKFAQ